MKNFDVSRLFQIIFACVFALSAFMVVFLLLRAYREQKAFENLALVAILVAGCFGGTCRRKKRRI